jgi:predicted glycogen debranching enzyme
LPRKAYLLSPGGRAGIPVAGLSPEDTDSVDEMEQSEKKRHTLVVGKGDSLERALRKAADAFVVKRKDGLSTILAGYPWFTDWGRDTMIALPGLTLVTGRFDDARSILEAYAHSCREGMLPNRFPDFGEDPDYNTVDASLWFFHAVDSYLRYTGDLAFVEEVLWPVMVEIIQWHQRGTRFGIVVAEDGLLRAGEPGTQLTWMDAKVGDWVVTPRQGKPVEINALWYNALKVAERLGIRFGDEAFSQACSAAAEKCRTSFGPAFWNHEAECLYDCIDDDFADDSIRPNQIFALSMPYRMLTEGQERKVLDVVERELVTPLGLRSLSANSPSYRGRYGGNQESRDGAYHQGTVWTWPIGAFVDAWVRLNGDTEEIRLEAAKFVDPFRAHLKEYCVGQISEIFEGDPPHTARGCFAQAWSVAEVLRIHVEVIQGRRPTYTDHFPSFQDRRHAEKESF